MRYEIRCLTFLFLVCSFSSYFQRCGANANLKLFPYGLDVRDVILSRDNDDISSPEYRLTVPINFYGLKHNSVYINQNGLISFQTEIPIFVNMQFPLDYPSIAPLYSDVDTRLAGSIYYRETQTQDLLERADKTLRDHFTSASSFQSTSLLIVTWDGVGYFDRKSDKMLNQSLPTDSKDFSDEIRKSNTYQIVVATDGVDSYTIFYYKNIEWIQGTGKNPSLPDAKAQAGLISGNGPYFSLQGSGTDQISNIHKRSNLGEEGVWAFHIGSVGDQVEEPDLNIGIDTTSESSASCASGATQCHSQAQCVDYSPGFCCSCVTGFYGNGRTCLQDATPQRVTGKVKGVLNGVAIEDSDLFSYILPGDGRAYTAIAKLPDRLGYDFQTLSILGTIIGWLFSIPVKGAPNGFKLTGGIFNYTAEISFQQTGQKLSIHQMYNGLDVFSHLKVETRIHGTTANIPVGKTIEVNDYEMLMTRVSPGLIRSQSNHNYRVVGTSNDYPFSVEQTISYEECPWVSPVQPNLETTKLKIGRNYIVYDPAQQIARYAITSKVTPTEGDDPCKENKEKCGPNSSCVANDDSFRCICNLGYEESYREGEERDAQIKDCVDIDECAIGTSTCDVTATCINLEGSHSCECQPGYSGDGYTCTKILSCDDVQCGQNARCVEASLGEPECRCLQGFDGDGLFCYERTDTEVPAGSSPDCRHVTSLCNPFADCIFSKSSGSHVCSCKRGYTGNGLECKRDRETCDVVNTCHPNALCLMDTNLNEKVCTCRTGYFGDGYSCSPEEQPFVPTNPEPTCLLTYCWCPSGFTFESVKKECHYSEAVTTPESTCVEDTSLCDPNANCLYDRGEYKCVCNSGYSGDGRYCIKERRPEPTCVGDRCWCPSGYSYDTLQRVCQNLGLDTSIESTCKDDPSLCDPNASCLQGRGGYECTCNSGFSGDGNNCVQETLKRHPDPTCLSGRCWCPSEYSYDSSRRVCEYKDVTPPRSFCGTERAQCDPNASCQQDGNDFSCICNSGYTGDGRSCALQDLCSSHAECSSFGECAYDRTELRYGCICREGFQGDGKDCRPKENVGCDVTRDCDANGQCAWDHTLTKYACRCTPGFRGNGLTCEEDLSGCNVLKNCGTNAECNYDYEESGYICRCKDGYDGDGYRCSSTKPCYVDKSICDKNADCLPNSETREWKCRCNEGWIGDGQECREEVKRSEDILLVTKGMSVIRVPLDGQNPDPITVEPFQTAIGIDIDCINQRMYWSDVAGREIKQAYFNGSEKKAFLENDIGSPEGLSLDWASQNLYFTDSLKDTIEVANLKSKDRKTLISTNLVNPRGIAVYPQRGRLFWSDWNRDYPKIEFAGLDGLGRQTLVGEGLALPNSLVIDTTTDQLCWGDAGTHKIECVGIDGRNRQTLVSSVKYPFGLVLTANTFYWSDWESKKIESASRSSGTLGTPINVDLGGPGKLYGMALIPKTCPQIYSPCSQSRCRANQICLPNIRGGISCRCTDSAPADCTDS